MIYNADVARRKCVESTFSPRTTGSERGTRAVSAAADVVAAEPLGPAHPMFMGPSTLDDPNLDAQTQSAPTDPPASDNSRENRSVSKQDSF